MGNITVLIGKSDWYVLVDQDCIAENIYLILRSAFRTQTGTESEFEILLLEAPVSGLAAEPRSPVP